MKNEVKVSVELTAENKVIVKNDTGSEWSYNIKEEYGMPYCMVSSIITSMLCASIIHIMDNQFENKLQFTIRLD